MKIETKENTIRIIIHILVWAVILVLPVYAAIRLRMGINFLFIYYTFMAINGLIFYINYLLFVPKLFLRKKKLRYYISILVLVLCFSFINDLANKQVYDFMSRSGNTGQLNTERFEGSPRSPGRLPVLRGLTIPGFIVIMPRARLVGYMASSLFMLFLSLGLRVLEHQSKMEKMQEERDKAKLNAELAFLKNQISPHFFYNTLNNIYSLIDKNAEDSKEAVVKLSKLMRYILNESDHDYQHLSAEIEFMNNYIDIMKLRLGKKTRLTVDFPTGYRDISVPPLLFIPIIENAFKHGVSVRKESNINISLVCGDKSISLTCINDLPESPVSDLESSGIGLGNLNKRLELLFPDRYELKTNKTDTVYKAYLTIWLKG